MRHGDRCYLDARHDGDCVFRDRDAIAAEVYAEIGRPGCEAVEGETPYTLADISAAQLAASDLREIQRQHDEAMRDLRAKVEADARAVERAEVEAEIVAWLDARWSARNKRFEDERESAMQDECESIAASIRRGEHRKGGA